METKQEVCKGFFSFRKPLFTENDVASPKARRTKLVSCTSCHCLENLAPSPSPCGEILSDSRYQLTRVEVRASCAPGMMLGHLRASPWSTQNYRIAVFYLCVTNEETVAIERLGQNATLVSASGNIKTQIYPTYLS